MSAFGYAATSYKPMTDCSFASAPFECKNIFVNVKAMAACAVAYFIAQIGLVGILIGIPVKICIQGI